MPSMTTYLSNGFFLLPLWFIRRDFSQNFNWLTVNFPICSALTLAQESHQERAQLVLALLARSPCCFELTARAIKPRLHATSGFFWNRCIKEDFYLPTSPPKMKPFPWPKWAMPTPFPSTRSMRKKKLKKPKKITADVSDSIFQEFGKFVRNKFILHVQRFFYKLLMSLQ